MSLSNPEGSDSRAEINKVTPGTGFFFVFLSYTCFNFLCTVGFQEQNEILHCFQQVYKIVQIRLIQKYHKKLFFLLSPLGEGEGTED